MDKAQGFLELAAAAERKIRKAWPASEAGRRLFWAAMNLGGVQVAVGMIEQLATVQGLRRLQETVRVEPYDVLEAAAVGLAARSAVSAMDLCAAAAWSVRPATPIAHGQEPDLKSLAPAKNRAELLPGHAQWVEDVATSREWRLMSESRNQATHRTFKRTVIVSLGSERIPHDEFIVSDVAYPADDLVRQFAHNAESWFRQFCAISPTSATPSDDSVRSNG
jgi:hypothetical protein